MRQTARYLWAVISALLVIAIVIYLFCVQLSAVSPFMGDFDAFRGAACRVRAGLDPYAVNYPPLVEPGIALSYLYPPMLAELLMPMCSLGDASARLLWSGISFFSLLMGLIVLLRCLRFMTAGAVLSDVHESIIVVAILFCEPLRAGFANGQVHAVIFLLIISALYSWLQGRGGRAGFMIGMAACIKIFPLLLLYPALRLRETRMLAGASLAAAVGIMLDFFATGGHLAIGSFISQYFPPSALLPPEFFFETNLSPALLVTRLINGTANSAVICAPSCSKNVALLIAAFVVTNALIFCEVVGWKSARNRALNFSLLLIGSIAASPILWSHHFTIAIIPLGLIAVSEREHGRQNWIVLGVLLLIFGVFNLAPSAQYLAELRGHRTALVWGVLPVLALAVLAVLTLRSAGRTAAPAPLQAR
ncbi:MAG: DUF2029 domain-containing protein [Oligoflexia bacterium]|nr:DUF2029 domain-containing protein [Oligoflexia bacterium]